MAVAKNTRSNADLKKKLDDTLGEGETQLDRPQTLEALGLVNGPPRVSEGFEKGAILPSLPSLAEALLRDADVQDAIRTAGISRDIPGLVRNR